MSLIIGPSTGWLYAIGVNSLVQQRTVSENAGANAVEFCIVASLEPTDVRVASMLDAKDQPFAAQHYRSLHLPDYKPEAESAAQAEMAMRIAVSQIASTILIHPLKVNGDYPIGYYDQLISVAGRRVRFAIENMDKNKPDGFLLPELEKLAQTCDSAFVLDIQHAYEHDSSMQYARDLFNAMRGRLTHLHVSGEIEGNNHCLLHRARNVKPLVEFLGEMFASLGNQSCPIILEGEYRTADDLAAEIEFIRKEVGTDVVHRLREGVDIAQGHHMAKMDIGTLSEKRSASFSVWEAEEKIRLFQRAWSRVKIVTEKKLQELTGLRKVAEFTEETEYRSFSMADTSTDEAIARRALEDDLRSKAETVGGDVATIKFEDLSAGLVSGQIKATCTVYSREKEDRMDRQAIIISRRELIGEMCSNSPAQIAINLGPAPEEEYQAYLARYERMREELAALNKQLGLPEDSMTSLAE